MFLQVLLNPFFPTQVCANVRAQCLDAMDEASARFDGCRRKKAN
jgi:hypothetical protein